MTEAPQILLAHHLKMLKLPTFLREYDKLARQCAAEGRDHVQFLTRLVELELIDRERRMVERRIKAATFPATKGLDSFDFRAIPKLNKTQVLIGPVPVSFRSFESDTRHQGDRIWQRCASGTNIFVWRCLRCTSRSPSSQASMIPVKASSFGRFTAACPR